MNSAPHRTNCDFQLRHFMAGSCYTADGAWALMYAQRIHLEAAVKKCEASILRRKAKRLAAEKILQNKSSGEGKRLRAEADLIDLEASEYIANMNHEAAKNELATIIKIMEELEPQRKYGHLPLLEANEAMQREEWLGEFKTRVENYLLSQGTIPHDQLNAMRNHPDFETSLIPHIRGTLEAMAKSPDKLSLMKAHQGGFLSYSKD